ncbi:hypothetical protein EOPP23_12020 [Endozoicomonas sp. OPT23]|uniref:type IV pilin protein n=1 Tax=Endozoicomonas sp. OPT23 TaxID=2072845 RepID=UPI00129A3242|nr:type IV pilin protein [Endozoicomonas sp. OPT23]MRI33713.1 hypothetical protein [Endozoicomonas sp. OPT23]
MIKYMKGFSLIELMIVVAIIAIISAIAIPSYTDYVTRSRRSEAIATLLQIMAQQERNFTEQLTYQTDLTLLGYSASPVITDNSYYSITAQTCTGSPALPITRCINLLATPQGSQLGDGNITIDSRGIKTPAAYWR